MTDAAPPSLADLVAEQVMRCSGDVDMAASFTATRPGTPQAAALVGRLLTLAPGITLVAGSPLCVWVSGGTLDPHWRAAYPPASDSAYAHLEFLAELYTDPVDITDPITHLVDLSARAALEIAVA